MTKRSVDDVFDKLAREERYSKELRHEVERLESQAVQDKETIVSLSHRFMIMKRRANDFSNKLAREERHSKKLSDEVGCLESQATQDKQTISSLEVSEAKAKEELSEANKTITQLQEKLDRAKGAETELDSLRSELTTLRSNLDKVSRERDTAKSQVKYASEYRKKFLVACNINLAYNVRTVIASIRHQSRTWFPSRTWQKRGVLKEVVRSLHRFKEGVPDYDSDTNYEGVKRLWEEVRREEACYIETAKAARQAAKSIHPTKLPRSQEKSDKRPLRVESDANRAFETRGFSCL